MSNFQPQIKKRSTEELLEIIGNEEEWEKIAVEYAYKELKIRNVSSKEFAEAKENYKFLKLQEETEKANESYSVIEFILEPLTIFAVVFQWEFKKDGYLRKARQLNRIRLAVVLIIFWIFLFITLK